MIGANDPTIELALAGQKHTAAMLAHIEESADFAFLGAHDRDGLSYQFVGHIAARFGQIGGMAGVKPRSYEYLTNLGILDVQQKIVSRRQDAGLACIFPKGVCPDFMCVHPPRPKAATVPLARV